MFYEKVALLGGSRGFGRSVTDLIVMASTSSNKSLRDYFKSAELLLISRKIEKFENLKSEKIKIFKADFSDEKNWPTVLEELKNFAPTRIYYFAGGGPHGFFQTKKWSDHDWAYRVNFLFPAFILHQIDFARPLKQIIFTGSSIAENKADPQAASYCAAKHALKGLITSLQAELKAQQVRLDLRLFSPGYMKTDLLPKNAWPHEQKLVKEPAEVAAQFVEWALNSDSFSQNLEVI